MYFHTCVGCKFSGGCDRAKGLREKLKGLGFTSAKFRCNERQNIFSPGQAVTFETYASSDDEYSSTVKVKYDGYVIEQIKGKVFGFIAKGTLDRNTDDYPFEPIKNGYVKIPIHRVAEDNSREKKDVKQCRWCGNHPSIGAPCGKDLHYTPQGECLADTLKP